MHKKGQVFFPGINSLRFFAALAVIITHIELLKGVFGYRHAWDHPVFFNLGGLGVYFFFVLSGFLITYLLLVEKETYGKIAVKSFYIRRILRIWPLYYFILVLGFFVLPHFHEINLPYLEKSFFMNFWKDLLFYALILPNLAFAAFPAVPHIGQLWSIGVEEQFYIGWPWLIDKSSNILKSLICVILIIICIKVVILSGAKWFANERWFAILKNFVAMSKFEYMAIGGIGSWYLFKKDRRVLDFIYNPVIYSISISAIPLLIYFTPPFLQDGIHIIYSGLFGIIIMNVANNKGMIKLENSVLNFLGKISYGIYMYHFIVIPIIIYSYKISGLAMSFVGFNIFVYSLSVAFTIIIASASYYIFERKFIHLKLKYTLVSSGDET